MIVMIVIAIAFGCWIWYELKHPIDQTEFEREHAECVKARKEKDEEESD